MRPRVANATTPAPSLTGADEPAGGMAARLADLPLEPRGPVWSPRPNPGPHVPRRVAVLPRSRVTLRMRVLRASEAGANRLHKLDDLQTLRFAGQALH